jgi:hypothetical protein
MLAIAGAVYSLADVAAPWVMGGNVGAGTTPLAGYLDGFQISAAVQIAGGVLGLLLLSPAGERGRFKLARAGI